MQKKKLTLRNLKVSSFVTQKGSTVKGGISNNACSVDNTLCYICPEPTVEHTCGTCGLTDVTNCFECTR